MIQSKNSRSNRPTKHNSTNPRPSTTSISLSTYIILIILTILITSFLSQTVIAAEGSAPALPGFYYGNATVNGRPVPVGSAVIAKINGSKAGEITVVLAGKYGDAASDAKLAVIGDSATAGKQVDFYIKLAGKKEIKSSTTGTWQSGSENPLNLIFTGDEIVEEVPQQPEEEEDTETSSQTGSGAAGGSAGAAGSEAGTSQAGKAAIFYFEKIEGGKQKDISVFAKDLPVTKLQLLLSSTVEKVDLSVKPIGEPKAPLMKDVYKYIEITAPKLTAAEIQTAIIKFIIPNDWFTENNYDPEKVVLLRFNSDRWNKLDTVFEGSDSSYHYYRASTPGFSYFAIASEKLPEAEKNESVEAQALAATEETGSAALEADGQKTGVIDSAKAAANKISGMAVSTIKRGGADVISIILIVALLIGIIVYVYDKKR